MCTGRQRRRGVRAPGAREARQEIGDRGRRRRARQQRVCAPSGRASGPSGLAPPPSARHHAWDVSTARIAPRGGGSGRGWPRSVAVQARDPLARPLAERRGAREATAGPWATWHPPSLSPHANRATCRQFAPRCCGALRERCASSLERLGRHETAITTCLGDGMSPLIGSRSGGDTRPRLARGPPPTTPHRRQHTHLTSPPGSPDSRRTLASPKSQISMLEECSSSTDWCRERMARVWWLARSGGWLVASLGWAFRWRRVQQSGCEPQHCMAAPHRVSVRNERSGWRRQKCTLGARSSLSTGGRVEQVRGRGKGDTVLS